MPNSPKQSQADNDEIDLADLIRALWQGKWLVIGVTLATLALGFAYSMTVPKSYTASLSILALPDSQADVYTELHEAQLIAADKQSLLALFVEDLESQTQIQSERGSGNGLGLYIASVTPTQAHLSFPTQAPGQLTEKVADALELANQNVNYQLELNLSSHGDKLLRNNTTAIETLDLERQQKIVLFKAHQNKQIAELKDQMQITRTNYDASIKKQILLLQQQISISRTNYDASIKKQISLLQQQISISRTNYAASVRARIAHLTEQATIARSLNIDKAYTTGDGKIFGIDTYFKGYLALEQSIKLIRSRTSRDDFIPNLADLEQRISQLHSQNAEDFLPNLADLEQQISQLNSQNAEDFVPYLVEKEVKINQLKSQKVEVLLPDLARIEFLQAELLKNKEGKRVDMMLAKTPIGTDQFVAVEYNLDSLVYKINTKTRLILALSIVLGGMLGIFVLLIRNVLIKQD